MNSKLNILLSSLIISILSVGQAQDSAPIRIGKFGLDTITLYPEQKTKVTIPTQNNFGASMNEQSFTTPAFIQYVLDSDKPLRILEIGPGEGFSLQELLLAQGEKDQSFTYSCVDLAPGTIQKIMSIFSKYRKKKCNALGKIHEGNAIDFMTGQHSAYDVILCNNVTHYLSPLEQLDFLTRCQLSLALGGTLFLSQCYITGGENWMMEGQNSRSQMALTSQFKENIQSGDIWPGYIIQADIAQSMIRYSLEAQGSQRVWYHPTLHSPKTLSDLVSLFGFKISSSQLFAEYTIASSTDFVMSTPRCGVIATKTDMLPDPRLIDYIQAAQDKILEIALLELDTLKSPISNSIFDNINTLLDKLTLRIQHPQIDSKSKEMLAREIPVFRKQAQTYKNGRNADMYLKGLQNVIQQIVNITQQ